MALVLTCNVADLSAGDCSAPFWAESAGFFSGWTTADLGLLAAGLLGLWAVWCIFRILWRWAETL